MAPNIWSTISCVGRIEMSTNPAVASPAVYSANDSAPAMQPT